MTVTKQQQLEWLAKHMVKWIRDEQEAYLMSVDEIGFIVGLATTMATNQMLYDRYHSITREEWQRERDKIGSKPEVDNSWHERGELPPVGGVCEAMINGEWIAAAVLRHRINSAGMNVAAVMSCASFGVYWSADFRPLRTEREKAIDEIAALVRDGLVPHEMAKEFAVKMHDAGLKLVKR